MVSGKASITARKAVRAVFVSTARDMWGEQWVRAAVFYLAVQIVTVLFAHLWDHDHLGEWWTQVWITAAAVGAVYLLVLLYRAVPRGYAAWRLWRSQPFTDEVMRENRALRALAVEIIKARDEAAWAEWAKAANAWHLKAADVHISVRMYIRQYVDEREAPLIQLDWPGHGYTLKAVQRFDTWAEAVPWALEFRWTSIMSRDWRPPYASWYYVRRAPPAAWRYVTRPLRRLASRKARQTP